MYSRFSLRTARLRCNAIVQTISIVWVCGTLQHQNIYPKQRQRCAIVPQYIEHFEIALSLFKVYVPTIKRDCPSMSSAVCCRSA